VILLADRIWAASGDHARLIAWHHVVLAVGNFKRQRGRRLRPASLHALDDQSAAYRSDELFVPGFDGAERIIVTDPESWRSLTSMLPGAGVPTDDRLRIPVRPVLTAWPWSVRLARVLEEVNRR
jgi:hypothetical protein